MKKFIVGIILLGTSSVGISGQFEINNHEQAINEAKNDVCKSILSMAKLIMTARQTGTPIDKALELVAPKDGKENIFDKINKNLVIDAYDQPRFSSEQFKKEQLNDFAAKHYISCVKAADQL